METLQFSFRNYQGNRPPFLIWGTETKEAYRLTEQDWMQLKHVAAFTSDIDFANLLWKPVDAESKGADIFVMATENEAFGWIRFYEKVNVSVTTAKVSGLEDSSYKITWVNTCTGKIEKADSKKGEITLTVPKLNEGKPDIAFKINKDK